MAEEEELDVDKYLRENYGFMSWAFDHPELGPILRRAAEEGLGEVELEAAIRATKWWKEQEAASRNWSRRVVEDPGSVEAEIQTQMLNLEQSASQLGIPIPTERLRAIAEESLKYQWDENELRKALLDEANYKPGDDYGGVTGNLASNQDRLRQTAQQYYVPVSDKAVFDWTMRMADGTATEDDFKRYISDIAVSRFPHLKPYIEKGIAPQTFFEPYVQTLAQTLEMNPQDIDLMSPKWSQILEFQDGENGRRPMTLYETRRFARSQEEWNFTDEARQSAANLTSTLLKTFGAI